MRLKKIKLLLAPIKTHDQSGRLLAKSRWRNRQFYIFWDALDFRIYGIEIEFLDGKPASDKRFVYQNFEEASFTSGRSLPFIYSYQTWFVLT